MNLPSTPTRATNSFSFVSMVARGTLSPKCCRRATATRHAPEEDSSTLRVCRSALVRFLEKVEEEVKERGVGIITSKEGVEELKEWERGVGEG